MVHNFNMSMIVQKIIAYLSVIIPDGYLLVTAASALPLIELKGAIPLGISKNLNPFAVFALSYLGSSAVAPLILLLLRPILDLIKRIPVFNRLAERIEARINYKAVRLGQKSATRKGAKSNVLCALFLFVALPLPLTGVYTGAAIACFLNADYTKSLVAILAGNFVAGLIVLAIALLFAPWADLIFAVFLLIVLFGLLLSIIFSAIKHRKQLNTSK